MKTALGSRYHYVQPAWQGSNLHEAMFMKLTVFWIQMRIRAYLHTCRPDCIDYKQNHPRHRYSGQIAYLPFATKRDWVFTQLLHMFINLLSPTSTDHGVQTPDMEGYVKGSWIIKAHL